MKKVSLLLLTALTLLCSQCGPGQTLTVTVLNPLNIERTAEVLLDWQKITEKVPVASEQEVAVYYGRERISCQLTTDRNGEKKLLVLVPLRANQKKILVIKKADKTVDFQQRAQAILYKRENGILQDGVYTGGKFRRVDDLKLLAGHRDHNDFFRWEGPGWESEKVGYRLYLDQRNTIDIFGKKVNYPVLQDVDKRDENGQPLAVYHEMQDWGMDIFKVGESMGVGTLGGIEKGKVKKVAPVDSTFYHLRDNGPLMAGLQLDYYGWQLDDKKYDLSAFLSITAESRLTCHEVIFHNDAPAVVVTGLANHGNVEVLKGDGKGAWNYFAVWGNQDIEGAKLGTVIFYRNQDLAELAQDEYSFLVKLNVKENYASFYFGAAWEFERNGVKTPAEFKQYLDEELARFNNPANITCL